MGDPEDDFLAALRVVVRCIRSPHKYFAKVSGQFPKERKFLELHVLLEY